VQSRSRHFLHLGVTVDTLDVCLKLGVMKSNVESRLKNYEQDVKKFEARWHQLKPSDALLDDDPSAGEQAVQLIKEKKQEFAELETTREALEYVSLSVCEICLLRANFKAVTGWTTSSCLLKIVMPLPG